MPTEEVPSEVVKRNNLDSVESTRKRKKEGEKIRSRKKHKNEGKDSSSSTRASTRAAVESDTNPESFGEEVSVEQVVTNGQKPRGEPGAVREKNKATKSAKEGSEQHKDGADDDEMMRKHSKILSKYQKSLGRQPETHRREEKQPELVVEAPKVDDLVPFTLPEAQPQSEPLNASAVLPPWLAKPTSVPRHAQKPFRRLDVDKDLLEKLRKKGFEDALPIQAAVLPLLLPKPTRHPGDLCISAATGSGKTLGYALPIVQSIMSHATTRLRALVVVPTRELVDQVRDAFAMCASGTKVRIGTAVGTHHFQREQKSLVEKTYKYDPRASIELRGKLERKMKFQEDDECDDDENRLDVSEELLNLLPRHVPEFVSNVDILIATPGRLVDHIKSTTGFTLTNLEWLVIDEADRLLDASFQQWVETLTGAINDTENQGVRPGSFELFSTVQKRPPRKVVLSATMTRDVEKLSGLQLQNPKMVVLEGGEESSKATDLKVYTGATGLPPTLNEFAVPVGDGSDKPLYLLHILQQIFSDTDPSRHVKSEDEKGRTGSKGDAGSDTSESGESSTESSGYDSTRSVDTNSSSSKISTTSQSEPSDKTPSNALVFTSSNESAHRLSRLLERLAPEYKQTMTKLTKSSTSRSTAKVLASFRASKLRILIATDRASRGLDLSNLQNVINYDIPHSITSYVHRVGRTARAGARGTSWTLVEDREAAWFWKEVAKGKEIGRNGKMVERKRIEVEGLRESAKEAYQEALEALRKDVEHDTRV